MTNFENTLCKTETPFGTFYAVAEQDPDYPCIKTYLRDYEGNDILISTVESTIDHPQNGTHQLRCLVYADPDIDEFTDDFSIYEGEPDENGEIR